MSRLKSPPQHAAARLTRFVGMLLEADLSRNCVTKITESVAPSDPHGVRASPPTSPWHIPNDDKSAINLEHILPDKPEGNWPQFTDEQVRLYYKRIGNLCLMRASDNSTARSADFAIKKPIFAKSPYVLTRQVADAAEWGWEEIVERQKMLAKIAVKTWFPHTQRSIPG